MNVITFTERERSLLIHLTRRQLDHDRAWLADLETMHAGLGETTAARLIVDDVATLVAKLEASTPPA